MGTPEVPTGSLSLSLVSCPMIPVAPAPSTRHDSHFVPSLSPFFKKAFILPIILLYALFGRKPPNPRGAFRKLIFATPPQTTAVFCPPLRCCCEDAAFERRHFAHSYLVAIKLLRLKCTGNVSLWHSNLFLGTVYFLMWKYVASFQLGWSENFTG